MLFALRNSLILLNFIAGAAGAVSHPIGIESKRYGESIAYDMNGKAQVAAVIKEKSGITHAVFVENGQIHQLETADEVESEARGINQRGQVIGSARKERIWRAFVYDKEHGKQEISTLGGRHSHGTGINDQGMATGFADDENGDWHAFLYQPGKALQDLGTLGGRVSYASGVNNQGQVVGTSMTANGSRHAFFYDAQKGMLDLGTLGGRYSTATALNDHGVVVGASETPGRRWHAFIHDGKKMIDLGAKIGMGDSFATGINNQGHVVGVVDLPDIRLAFVWRDNKMILHPAGKSLYLTNAINNYGQVIGASYDRGLYAATMPSNAKPFVDHGGDKIFGFNLVALIIAALMAIYRKRIKGLFFSNQGA